MGHVQWPETGARETAMTPAESLLDTLVSFPTVSRDSNLAMIEFIRSYLDELGIKSILTHNDERTKANLYAMFGPGKQGGVMLSGHTDVVPVEGQDWSREPFRMCLEDGRFYGRGATDMKGFIASALAMVAEAVKRDLKHPLHLAFSYDEEIGCVGVRRMIDMLESAPQRPGFCIVGEPTSLRVAIAHKGKVGAICRCHGVEAHSALANSGLNAIYLATEMINGIRDLQDRVKREHEHDDRFGVPWTTLHVGTIHGGTALNIIPNRCEFRFEIRNLKADDPMDIMAGIRNHAEQVKAAYAGDFPEVEIEVEVFNEYPALDTGAAEEVVGYVQSLLEPESAEPIKIDFGTEGGLFRTRLGIPTVVCGPGSMRQGHKPDEFLAKSELERCDRFLARLLDDMTV